MALVRKEQKGVKIAKMQPKIMFTKTSKTRHFLVFVKIGIADNKAIKSWLCLASGGGMNT